MTGRRVETGGLIDRSRTLAFSFDGRSYRGHPGDTLASALLANGVQILGRSFKYHRPRGVWGAWFDDPNAIMNVRLGDDEFPNCPAATTPLENGMQARAVNAFPNARHDIKGLLDRFSRFMPAGFYYKTFMWPDWHLFEPAIRRMAGLGHLNPAEIKDYQSGQTHDRCDMLVIGGGPAGLVAARRAAETGQSVLLIEDHHKAGGSLYRSADQIDGQPVADWVRAQVQALTAAGGRIRLNATAYGIYDHGMVAVAHSNGLTRAPDLIRVRAKQVVLATGAIDRPLTFANNDRPGVMSLDGAAEYLGRHGVLVGQKIAVLATHSHARTLTERLSEAGADIRQIVPAGKLPEALGRSRVTGVKLGSKRIACDTILASAGYVPLVHLWRHAGGKLDWDAEKSAFVPGQSPDNMIAIGAANGTFDLEHALEEARAAGSGQPLPPPSGSYGAQPPAPQTGSRKRQWIDFQHDVTLKDIELAARENYVSVEHLKRYTTLGMASDQGKTSNLPGLTAMAAIQGKSVPETGTTTFRPPFVPVPVELYRGARRQQQFQPLKRLPLEAQHRAQGAALGEYGGWLRPGWYGSGDTETEIRREVLMARNSAAVSDASPLGKIEVMGPDAEAFVDFIYYNTICTLKPGHIRYCFMLTETGIVYDDGVIARMDDNRFVISCSSSHVTGVNGLLEAWRQDGNDPNRIFVHDTTQNWPTVTVSGPRARDIVTQLDLGINLSPDVFPHMTWRAGQFQGAPARVARVSFTGDLSYEISVPVSSVDALWQAASDAAAPLDAGPIGLEALSILRAEKGYLIIGKDTDGETMPHDLGFGIPRQRKKTAFVGDRSLHSDKASQPHRKQLVGLEVADNGAPLPTGAHVVTGNGAQLQSCGYVTSSYHSPTLNRPIALGLVQAGCGETGDEVDIFHLGQRRKAVLASPCFFDPEGDRIHA
jgi:sarcosine oxidase subunit alpha